MSIPQHIAGLLEDYRETTLDASGHESLTAWLNESETNREAFATWLFSEVELLEASRLADMRNVFEGLTFHTRRGNNTTDSSRARPSRLESRALVAIAASLLVMLAGTYVWSTANKKNSIGEVASSNARRANNVATPPAMLSRVSDCIWERNATPLRIGQDIAPGTTIDIKSGLAQLVFESGAEVILKGPCRLRVDTSMLCQLFAGDVSAEVPQRAAGFTIRGPSAEVIDLGTRFGFSVGTAGNSEVHVFQGEVISRQLDERGDVVGKEIRLKKDQAILFPGERKQAQKLAANEAKFALEVKPLWLHDDIQPLVIDRKLELWLRAEHGVQTDAKQRVVAWQDLALGPNRLSNDAFQPDAKARPEFVLGAIQGRPAIRFNGAATHLTTTPCTTTNNQTIVAVFQYAAPLAGRDRVGGQIINYNGPPSRFLPDVHSPGVLQLGEKIDVWNGPQLSIAAKAFVGRDSSGADVSAGIVVSKSLGHSQPHVVSHVYSNSQNSATLYVDGQVVDQSSAPTSVAVTSRKVIGKHGIFDQWYFHGDLGEVIILNTALSPAEITVLSRQLMDHYGIPSSAGATL
jgi:hypothetical protein